MATGQRPLLNRPPRPVPPRGLIFLASGWLIASWLLSLGIRPPVQAHAASYAPGVRLMSLSLVIGIGIAWPLVRLSGPARAWPIRQAMLDLVVLLCLAQVVIWPLRLVTPWLPARSAAIDLCIGGWGFATAALIAIGTVPVQRGSATIRILAMLAAVTAVIAGPAIAFVASGQVPFAADSAPASLSAWWSWIGWSPITAVHALTAPNPKPPIAAEWDAAWLGWIVAAGMWLLAAVAQPLLHRLTWIEPEASAAAEEQSAVDAEVPSAA